MKRSKRFVSGEEILIYKCQLKQKEGRFCGVACYKAWRSKYAPVRRKCHVCGRDFTVRLVALRIGRGRFCSRKCAGIWQSNNRRGEKSSGWKGGISSDRHIIRESKKYSAWRKKVFERDHFICRKCGCKGRGNLHAHHIKRFSVILSDIRQKYPLLTTIDIARNYPELWDIKNGKTLCKECHKIAHQ